MFVRLTCEDDLRCCLRIQKAGVRITLRQDIQRRMVNFDRRVASVSTPQKPHRGCPRSLALGDRGDSGPQLAGRSARSSRIGPGKRRCGRQPRRTSHSRPLAASDASTPVNPSPQIRLNIPLITNPLFLSGTLQIISTNSLHSK
jgi:hypothetical protein